jgi:hypothetical protein
MARLSRAALIALLAAGVSAPAAAQLPNPFEIIFGPARPPADVPSSRPSQDIPTRPGGGANQPAPMQTQPLPPPQSRPPAQASRPPAPTGVQSQPLPAPNGGVTAPAPTQANAPAANQQPVRPQRGPPQPADTSPKPGDEVVVAPPSQKITNPTAVFSGLDKITGRIISFDVALNETVQFGALQVTPRACYTRPPTETPNTDAFIEVEEVTLQGEVKRIFTGWMFAASPGLHAVEHPIYDVWLVDCKKEPPTVTAGAQPTAKK